MRLLTMALVLACALGGTVRAADVSPADREAIQGVIASQIEAFRHDDATGAFEFASPTIQGMFGDADRFLAMVRQGYQPVYRPRSVAFGEIASTAGGRMVQRVEVVGPDGRARLALYTMEREPDGNWRIAACELTDSEAVAA